MYNNWNKYFLGIFIFLIVFSSSAQCAMCRAVLESEEGGTKAAAVNDGIIYLMVFPYVMVAIVFYVVYQMKYKKKKDLKT
jgi:heme/copper-type cytochrome/quinol oxidase subunit 2